MSQKYALVTDTDHGVGLALTQQLLERGYYVVAARLNSEETAIDQLRTKYPNTLSIVHLDISDDDSVCTMAKQVSNLVPHLDLLINNAGILGDMNKVLGDELDFQEMLRVINVNALGPLRVTNALVDLILKSTDKTVLNISSEAGSLADCEREGWFGYCMSKSATNMQSVLVHNNLRKHGGKVVVMHPGHVATYMRGHLDTTAKITPEESASGILQVILEHPELSLNKRPDYIDYQGEKLPW